MLNKVKFCVSLFCVKMEQQNGIKKKKSNKNNPKLTHMLPTTHTGTHTHIHPKQRKRGTVIDL